MKLLFAHERLGSLGGAEVNALLTARELKARGHAVALLHGPATGKGEAGWRETFAPCFAWENQSSALRDALAQFQPDAIYVHKLSDLTLLEGLLDSGMPLARMVHDHEMYCMRGYKYFYRSREICRRAVSPYCVFPCGASIARNHDGPLPVKWVSYFAKRREVALNRRFHRLVVAGDYMREELLRNGFDPARIEMHAPIPRPGDTSLRSSFSERNLILFAGQIIRGKGVDVLLESLALVRQPFECIILGDGSHRAHCEELNRRLGLVDRLHFKGFVPQEELKSYYRECSVVVVSSVWGEPFGAVGVEAMRYALPVVAFDAGGVREWLTDGESGFLVPWMDRAQFAAKIDALLADKALARRLGQRGLELAAQKFDFPRYIDGLERMFQSLVQTTPRNSRA